MFRPSGSAPMNAGVEVHALGEAAGGGRGGPVRAVEHHQAIAAARPRRTSRASQSA